MEKEINMPKGKEIKGPDYVEVINPQGYLNNREITNLDGLYLVKGSRDCVIVNKEKVSSRKGYEVMGGAKTKNKGYKDSYDWETSSNVTRSVRLNVDGELEVFYAGVWTTIKTYTAGTRANFAPWWDGTTELLDLLLFTIQTDGIQMWSGGAAKVGSATSTTLTIQGYKAATTIAFNENTSDNDTITDSGNGFLNAGFAVGDVITISGSGSNDGTYTIKAVTAGVITLADTDDLATEAAGASVVITRPGATWAESRFLTAGTRKVVIAGVEYAYTGGETTATLTGLSGLPAISTGTIALQAVRESTPATLDGLTLDLIATFNNYVLYGDLTSRVVNMSTSTDYTAFTIATPRIPTNGAIITLDSTPTAFVSGAVEDEIYICGRKDDWYKITFELSADLSDESIRVKKLPTSTGQAARSQSCVFRIKNGVAFLSFEPAIDTLTRLLTINNPTSLPLSDDIKNDIESYDLTDANGLFYQNQLFICLPAESVVLIYDFISQHWQPPHNLPIGRLALIDVDEDGTQVLCGHSNFSNETYQLYSGYNDNGTPIRMEAHFGYENFGSRFSTKSADEYATELYMSDNTTVKNRIVYEYKGAAEIREFDMEGGTEANRFSPRYGGPLGFDPLGTNPIGSLATGVDDLSKYRFVDTTSRLDFFERQRIYIAEGVDMRCSLIAYGENVELSENIPSFLKR